MYNSRTNPTHSLSDQHHSNQHSRRKKPQKAPPPVQGAVHDLFYGQSLRQVASASLHYTPGLHFVPPPFVTFRSLSASSLGYPRKSASFIPLRSCLPAVSFRSPLAFPPTNQNSKPKRVATFHPSQFATFHSVTTLAFPHANQRYALRSVHP